MGTHGLSRKKENMSESKLKKYISKKLLNFMSDDVAMSENTQDSFPGSLPANFYQPLMSDKKREFQKVLVVTIACSDKMAVNQNYNKLQSALTEQIEEMRKQIGNNELIVCMNIHSNGNKLKSCSDEKVNPALWSEFTTESMENSILDT